MGIGDEGYYKNILVFLDKKVKDKLTFGEFYA